VVGVTGSQPATVVRQAAQLARRFEAVLVCAHVDRGSYVVAEHPDGSVASRPLDPDRVDWEPVTFDERLAVELGRLADEEHVAVEFRELAGDPAVALARLAEVLNAELVVVGTRRRRLRASLPDYFGGSVAAQLAHRQCRPVVVIPRGGGQAERTPPWEGTRS